jgi:hypothetical protein
MYRELPEQHRTSGIVAERLQAQGYSVDASRARDILEATVLADIDVESIRNAGRTLRVLVNIFDTSKMRPCEFDKDDPFYNPLDYEFVEALLGGLRRGHPMELDVLTDALARLLDSYMAHRGQAFSECMLKLARPAGWRE